MSWRSIFLFAGFLIPTYSLYAATPSGFISPPPVPGWQHNSIVTPDTSERHGTVLGGGRIKYSSPVIAEVDGNKSNGKEVVFIGGDYIIHAVSSSGTELWRYKIADPGCGSRPSTRSSPAVGDLFGNGTPYVVAGYGGIPGKCDGGVVALRGRDGKPAWKFSAKRFNRRTRIRAVSYAVTSTPALADVNHDGKMEIAFGSLERNIYLLNADGSLRWYYNAADCVYSSAAFANVDDDPDLELIIGTAITQNKRLRPPTPDGGYVYAFKTKARKNKRIFFRDKTAYLWQATFDQVMQSSPVVADLLPSNPGSEVIVGSGCTFPARSTNKRGRWVKVLSARTGKVLQTLNASTCFSSPVAVGDIDEDGRLEIVATVNGGKNVGGTGRGTLNAWKADNPVPIWSMIPKTAGRNDPLLGTFTSPVIADLDGNGSLEVAVANENGIVIVNGRDGTPLTCQESDCANSVLLYTFAEVSSTPAVGDINNDGILDLVAGSAHEGLSGAVGFAWTDFAGILGSPAGSFPAYSAPWPMFRGNAQRTGSLF